MCEAILGVGEKDIHDHVKKKDLKINNIIIFLFH